MMFRASFYCFHVTEFRPMVEKHDFDISMCLVDEVEDNVSLRCRVNNHEHPLRSKLCITHILLIKRKDQDPRGASILNLRPELLLRMDKNTDVVDHTHTHRSVDVSCTCESVQRLQLSVDADGEARGAQSAVFLQRTRTGRMFAAQRLRSGTDLLIQTLLKPESHRAASCYNPDFLKLASFIHTRSVSYSQLLSTHSC